MVGSVDLLHFHLSVHIAVVQEVDIGDFHLEVCDEESSISGSVCKE